MLPCCGAGKNEIFLNLGGSDCTLAVEQISLVLESPHPGQISRGKFQGVKEIRHPKGKFMMLKPGHSMLVVKASLASDTLELSCRKLVVDFHLKLKLILQTQ